MLHNTLSKAVVISLALITAIEAISDVVRLHSLYESIIGWMHESGVFDVSIKWMNAITMALYVLVFKTYFPHYMILVLIALLIWKK
jgi:hypothetical protein